MKQKHLILILSLIFINILRRSWRDFPKYYKSLAYVSIVNALYYCLCRRHLVWEFLPLGMNWWQIRFLHVFIVSPLLVLSYLANYPKSLLKQVIHLIQSVLVSTLFECYLRKKKMIQYKHSWNEFWTGLIYLKMYVYSYLFSKRPLTTIFLSICSMIFFIVKFKVPIKKKHVFSRKFDHLVDYFYHSFLEDVF